jgi:GNAT superfamily N-acetyltransferase
VSRRIGEILENHLANKVACNWIVGPVSQPEDLGKHLRAHGFHCMIHCAGMACNLNLLTPAPQPPRGVMISMVEQPPLLRPVTTERRKRMQEARQILTQLTPKQVWCFSATLDGVPVGETMLCAGAGVGGIYNVEVLEKFRRRGVGSALVHAALTQARKLGFHAAVLGATGMGQQIYSRLNFQEVCKLSFYKYGKMRQLEC